MATRLSSKLILHFKYKIIYTSVFNATSHIGYMVTMKYGFISESKKSFLLI